MKRILTIAAAMICLWGCEKNAGPEPGTFEALAEEMCGDYVLTGMHWSGSPIDLNGDGTGYNNLIKELCWFNGYYEPYHLAEVAESCIIGNDDDRTFAISVMLPYPDFRMNNVKSTIAGVSYLPLTLRETYIGGDTGVALTYGPISFDNVDDDQIFLKGITELRITDFKEGQFTVRMRCHLREAGDDDYKLDYLHYYYRKVN